MDSQNTVSDGENGDLQPFWRDVLERIGKKDPPFNTYIRGNFLFSKDSQYFIDISVSSSRELIQFFESKIGLKLEVVKSENWKDLRKKAVRDKTICDFAYRMKDTYDLSEEITQQLMSQIHLDISLKKITSDDIIFMEESNGSIDFIQGFEFEEGNYRCNEL